jgi:hypothetical protein
LDIDDGVGLGELATQAVVLPRELIQPPRLGQRGVGLTPTLLRFECGLFDAARFLRQVASKEE